MDKTIKFPAVLLFVFLFLITKAVADLPYPPYVCTISSIKCTTSKDCPDCQIFRNMWVSICEFGYCLIATQNPEYKDFYW
jgi:hypothetical protein